LSSIDIPITLAANQTWTIAGTGVNASSVDGLRLGAPVTGSSAALRISFGNLGGLYPLADMEVGALSVAGDGSLNSGVLSTTGASINGSDGNPLRFSDGAELQVPFNNATSGPITTSGGTISVGEPGSVGTLAVNGGITLDANSILFSWIDQAGTTPGTDISQLTATGNVNLGGAELDLYDHKNPGPSCSTLAPGNVLVLLSTTGTLSGTFGNASDGSIYTITDGNLNDCGTAQINYTAHAVTATVLTSTTAPTLQPVSALSPFWALPNQPFEMPVRQLRR
jgi:hypothetical protein